MCHCTTVTFATSCVTVSAVVIATAFDAEGVVNIVCCAAVSTVAAPAVTTSVQLPVGLGVAPDTEAVTPDAVTELGAPLEPDTSTTVVQLAPFKAVVKFAPLTEFAKISGTLSSCPVKVAIWYVSPPTVSVIFELLGLSV